MLTTWLLATPLSLAPADRELESVDWTVGYLHNVNRIFGDGNNPGTAMDGDAPLDGLIWNVAFDIEDVVRIVQYVYHLDFRGGGNGTFAPISTATYGARVTADVPLGDGGAIGGVLEGAYQRDVGSNPNDVETEYWNLEVNGKAGPVELRGGVEVLGGDSDGGDAFSTPLATLHAFNGWADQFLVTPATGLLDGDPRRRRSAEPAVLLPPLRVGVGQPRLWPGVQRADPLAAVEEGDDRDEVRELPRAALLGRHAEVLDLAQGQPLTPRLLPGHTSPMHVSELMSTDPVAVEPEASVEQAYELLERCGIRHLPVVRGAELLGVVSDRDLGTAVEELAARRFAAPEDSTLVVPTVRSVMGSELFAVQPDTDVLDATQLMLQRKVGCLPVAKDGQLAGLLTERDVLGAFLHGCEEGGGDTLNPPVSTRMTRNRISVEPRTPVEEALSMCAAADIRHLLVMGDSTTLCGIVSDRDLLKVAARAGETPVEQCMSREPVVIWPTAPLAAAARIMLMESVSSLPVVEEDRLVGILTITDLLDHCMTTRGALRPWSDDRSKPSS